MPERSEENPIGNQTSQPSSSIERIYDPCRGCGCDSRSVGAYVALGQTGLKTGPPVQAMLIVLRRLALLIVFPNRVQLEQETQTVEAP
jgi:hypothetical protein